MEINDKNEKGIMKKKGVLQVWEEYSKALLHQQKSRELDLPSALEGDRESSEEDEESQVTAIDEMRVEVVAKYLNQLYKKIVEYLYGGRKNPEFMCMTGNTQRHHAGESTGWKDGGKNEMGIRG